MAHLCEGDGAEAPPKEEGEAMKKVAVLEIKTDATNEGVESLILEAFHREAHPLDVTQIMVMQIQEEDDG